MDSKPPMIDLSVTIYSTSWCGFCKAEKNFLDANGISYTSLDIENDPQAAAERDRLMPQPGVPLTVIKNPDGQAVIILGFDQPKLTKALDLITTEKLNHPE